MYWTVKVRTGRVYTDGSRMDERDGLIAVYATGEDASAAEDNVRYWLNDLGPQARVYTPADKPRRALLSIHGDTWESRQVARVPKGKLTVITPVES